MVLKPQPPSDFLNAHHRHWTDAELLYSQDRRANADHLYGLSAECGLKAILVQRQWVNVDPQGDPERPFKRHIDELWDSFVSLAQQRLAARYVSLLPSSNPFHDWHIGQRYANEAHFDERMVNAHRQGAEHVRSLVQEARKDGLIP